MSYCPAKTSCPTFAPTGATPGAGTTPTNTQSQAIARQVVEAIGDDYMVVGVFKDPSKSPLSRSFTDREDASVFFDTIADDASARTKAFGDLVYLGLFYFKERDNYDAPAGQVDERVYAGGFISKWDLKSKLPWFVAAAAIVGVAYYYGKPRYGAAGRKRRPRRRTRRSSARRVRRAIARRRSR